VRYLSTRDPRPAPATHSFDDVLLAGLAEDGGLFVPESLPIRFLDPSALAAPKGRRGERGPSCRCERAGHAAHQVGHRRKETLASGCVRRSSVSTRPCRHGNRLQPSAGSTGATAGEAATLQRLEWTLEQGVEVERRLQKRGGPEIQLFRHALHLGLDRAGEDIQDLDRVVRDLYARLTKERSVHNDWLASQPTLRSGVGPGR